MIFRKNKKFDNEYIDYIEHLFNSFIEACSTLGDKAFFRNSRFSKTLFESVFVAAATPSFVDQKIITSKIEPTSFEYLRNDEEFVSYLQSGSSSRDNITGRIKRAKEVLKLQGENCNA